MEAAYLFWKKLQDRWLAPVSAIMLLAPILLACVEVIRRYFFGVSWDWQQDVVTYTIISSAFLYFATTQRKEGHLRVTLFADLVAKRSPLAGQNVSLFAQICSIFYLVYFTYYSVKMTVRIYADNTLVLSQVMPLWPFFLFLTLGTALMAISFLFQVYRTVQAMRGKAVFPEELDAGH
jgi:TRAP-type C4-dicarboxylate transport system permease small subunit